MRCGVFLEVLSLVENTFSFQDISAQQRQRSFPHGDEFVLHAIVVLRATLSVSLGGFFVALSLACTRVFAKLFDLLYPSCNYPHKKLSRLPGPCTQETSCPSYPPKKLPPKKTTCPHAFYKSHDEPTQETVHWLPMHPRNCMSKLHP